MLKKGWDELGPIFTIFYRALFLDFPLFLRESETLKSVRQKLDHDLQQLYNEKGCYEIKGGEIMEAAVEQK